VEVLAVQLSVTECATGATPVPVREIVAGEEVALLATVAVPVTAPAAEGAKVTVRVAVCPGATIRPEETPLAVKPAPVMLTLEMLTFELPALVKVTLRALLVPVVTLEKARLVLLALRMNVAGVTVSVAALLVTLPTLFVTVTLNVAPLSEDVVAAVV
jgi:hypothetical protein